MPSQESYISTAMSLLSTVQIFQTPTITALSDFMTFDRDDQTNSDSSYPTILSVFLSISISPSCLSLDIAAASAFIRCFEY